MRNVSLQGSHPSNYIITTSRLSEKLFQVLMRSRRCQDTRSDLGATADSVVLRPVDRLAPELLEHVFRLGAEADPARFPTIVAQGLDVVCPFDHCMPSLTLGFSLQCVHIGGHWLLTRALCGRTSTGAGGSLRERRDFGYSGRSQLTFKSHYAWRTASTQLQVKWSRS